MAPSLRAFLEIPASHALDVGTDGADVLVASNRSGTMQLYRVPVDGGDPVQLTDLPEPVSGRLVPGSSQVVVSMDHGGDERHQLYRLDEPMGELRDLVVDHDHIHRLGGLSRDGRLLSYATNRRNGVDFDVVVRDLRDGSERVVFDRGGWCEAGGFSPDARFVTVGVATDRAMDNQLYVCDLAGGAVIHLSPHEDEAIFEEPAWLPGGGAVLMATDSGRDTMSLARFDLASGSWSYAFEVGWECSCWIDAAGRRLLVARNQDGHSRLDLLDPGTLATVESVPLPGEGIAWRPSVVPSPQPVEGGGVVMSFTSPAEPGDVWLAGADGGLRRLTSSPREVPAADCAEPTSHRIPSFDGEEVPAFLYRPRGAVDGPPPVVVVIHGGPESQTVLAWNPVIQYLVSRGYAVVAPNVRGSTGYGKRWTHLDDRRLRLDSVRDLAAIHAWLPGAGLDQRRAALYGGSYGGYMVLAGLAIQPELWAAGVDVVGISSLVTFLENTSPWRRATREREYGSLAEDRDFLLEASPLTHVERMRAPLFIVHGANDPRVPLSEAEQIHSVLRAKGVDTELLVYADEGHGLARLSNRLDAYPRMVEFLDRVLRAPQGAAAAS
ncbi:MAG: S9 family peptidase [Chloroflexi bacterium]|nr:MAG: S9 family peptidase [Chloroflexota bacterium]